MRHIMAECNRKLGGLHWANAKAEARDIRYACVLLIILHMVSPMTNV